ncbi:MAG TPA: CcmD family protein [Longimicrobium sp.]|jgi:CcmD family protein|nr:CcmD family protein [Longimicrobium sp.]
MNEWNFVGAAYGLTWVVLAGYALYLNGRVRAAREALRRVEVDR